MFQHTANHPVFGLGVPKPELPNVQIGLPRPKRRKSDRFYFTDTFHDTISRELRPTQFFIPRLQRIIRKVLRLRDMMKIMVYNLAYQSWAGAGPGHFGAFMTVYMTLHTSCAW